PVYAVADSGRLTAVSLQEAGKGTPPGGQLSSDSHIWRLTDGLDSHASYTLTATAVNSTGQSVSSHVSFTTLSADSRLMTNVFPGDGSTVGVGEPIDLTFNNGIPDDRKAALLQRIQIASTPGVMGAWHWFSDTQVHFRPQNYWPSGTKVSITANLKGFDAGGGVWGLGDWSSSFTIGAKHVSVIDDKTDQMQVYDNDQLINTWPVSMGKPGFPTLEGTLVVLFKVYKVKMNSCSTFGTTAACVPGGANYYNEDVFYDTAISTNGFFIHAAPWSVYAQGRYDVSHGCVNLSTERATTFYNWSQIGDVVIIQHTGNVADITNGEADWQINFSQFANTAGDGPVFTGNGAGPFSSSATHVY
ncbi:MAG TPA: Ig-like domain-containing protein, partial [Candidatus Dormibacteraeota bacterium]|nr:Ig-like domain-containing protein [Candidatus Dormibacteraeota bacterium]